MYDGPSVGYSHEQPDKSGTQASPKVHKVFYCLHCWFWIQTFSAENNWAKRIEVVHWAVSGHSTSCWAPNPNTQASLQHRNSITLFAPYYLWFLKSIILYQKEIARQTSHTHCYLKNKRYSNRVFGKVIFFLCDYSKLLWVVWSNHSLKYKI